MDIATAATLGATAVTLAWFIRDMKRENTKVLKRIEEGQERQTNAIVNGQESMGKILERVEEGQERQTEAITKGMERQTDIIVRGFETLSKDSVNIAKILEQIKSNSKH